MTLSLPPDVKRRLGRLLVMGIVGCGGGSDATPLPDVATTQPDVNATPQPDANAASLPDAAATLKQPLTPAQLAVGAPIENSIGMLLVPIPAGEFLMGSPATEPGRQLVGGAAPSDSDQTVPSWLARGNTGPIWPTLFCTVTPKTPRDSRMSASPRLVKLR